MLVTDSFVMLNNPKSGSSFARTVIKELFTHERRKGSFIRELVLPNMKISGRQVRRDPHGTYSQIPNQYRDREIVSVVRNPYSRFVSVYRFRWWARHPSLSRPVIAAEFPRFPWLTIDEFVEFNRLTTVHARLEGIAPKVRVGDQSAQFVQMFFREPKVALSKLSDAYIDSSEIFSDVGQITFLRQENLNRELADFLLRKGFSHEEADYVRQREKINVTRTSGTGRVSLTATAEEYIHKEERLIFRVLKERGIEYEPQARR